MCLTLRFLWWQYFTGRLQVDPSKRCSGFVYGFYFVSSIVCFVLFAILLPMFVCFIARLSIADFRKNYKHRREDELSDLWHFVLESPYNFQGAKSLRLIEKSKAKDETLSKRERASGMSKNFKGTVDDESMRRPVQRKPASRSVTASTLNAVGNHSSLYRCGKRN